MIEKMMPLRTHRAWLLTVPVLLGAMFLLLNVVGQTQMHPDETLVYTFTRADLAYTVNYLATQDVHPPLWFSFFWAWRQVAGENEFTGRMQALLFSLITLALGYRLGRDWFGNRSVSGARAGLLTMLILSVSAYFTAYALEIRPYALVMLLASLSMWVYARWLRRGTWRLAVAYGAITAVMFYVHYFLAFLVIAQVIFFLLRRPARQRIIQGMGAGGLAFVIWLPWLPSFLHQVSLLRQLAQQAGDAYGLGVGTPATTQATTLETVARLVNLATNGQPGLYALVLVVGGALLWRRTRFRLALIWALGVPVIALALNTVAAVYTQRYVAYLTPGLALALAAGLRALPLRWLRIAGAGAFVALNFALMFAWLPVRIPYRDLYADVSRSIEAGDVVFNTPAPQYDGFVQWQQDHYLAPGVTLNRTTDLTRAQAARRVWFMTGDWFNEAVRAQFDQLEPTHPVQQVIGQCDLSWCYLAQLMEAPPFGTPVGFGDHMDFWGVDVDSVTTTAITTRLWWRVGQAPPLDYSFSLRLIDASGMLVAQKDGPIIHYGVDTVQTSQLQPGKIYIDHRALDLPSGLPSGDYRLELLVYQPWDGVALTLPDGADRLVLVERLRFP